jgi:hypothetical protein
MMAFGMRNRCLRGDPRKRAHGQPVVRLELGMKRRRELTVLLA